MQWRDVQFSVGKAMIVIAVLAVSLAVILALREEPLVPDPPYLRKSAPSNTSPVKRQRSLSGIKIAVHRATSPDRDQ
jgi:hypothetical protein